MKSRACNRVECQLIGCHTRACDREAAREELRKYNPKFSEADLSEALDDLEAMERTIHPERFPK